MTAIAGEYTLALRRQRQQVERCNHPLTDGRTCVHVKGAPRIRYEPCPLRESYGPGADDKCWHPFATDEPHRHAHTWQLGDARYGERGGRLVNLETGEFAGNAGFGTDEIIEGVRAGRASWTDAEKQVNARRVLRLYGFDPPDGDYVVQVDRITEAGIAVEWHYHGASGWSYGTDGDGHSYEKSPDGKLKRIYSQDERSETVGYARRFGPAKAGQKFGIPDGTVRSWVTRAS
jgi:hypothetical protein